jgi:DNA-binding transcriptional ArsR family regulator
MVSGELSQVLRAVADPTRRRILELLGERQRSVSEIAGLFPMSRPAISKHLRVLREAGLVAERRRGRQRVYSSQVDRLQPLEAWLGGLRGGLAPARVEVSEAPAASRPRGAHRAARAVEARDELAPEDQEHEWRSW